MPSGCLGITIRGWPTSGEIDILEHIGREPNTIYATVHAPGYSGGDGVGSSLDVEPDTLKDEFHVYAIEWEENEIRWYFDDQEYFKVTPADVPDEWIFDHEFYIIMNLAVGGRLARLPRRHNCLPAVFDRGLRPRVSEAVIKLA